MDYNKQKQYLENRNYLLTLSDEDLIVRIIKDPDHISIIFEKYHESFAKKLNFRYKDLDFQTIQDIVIDSILVLKDIILKLGVKLLKEYTLSSYLIGICSNKIKREIKTYSGKYISTDFENQNDNSDEYDNYTSENNTHDQLDHIADQEILVFSRGIIDQKTSIMIQALKTMKDLGGKCYSLIILSSSTDYNYKISDLTNLFNYNKDVTTRNQKYKCIQRFKAIYSQYQLT